MSLFDNDPFNHIPDADKKELAAIAKNVAEEVKEHARKVLSPEDYDVYTEIMTGMGQTCMLLAMIGKIAIWDEVLASQNRVSAVRVATMKKQNDEANKDNAVG